MILNSKLIDHVTFKDQQEALTNFLVGNHPNKIDTTNLKNGDIILVTLTEKNKDKLYICCPKCGSNSFTGNHNITHIDNIISATPSLLFQCCGWHGYLTNGIFKEC